MLKFSKNFTLSWNARNLNTSPSMKKTISITTNVFFLEYGVSSNGVRPYPKHTGNLLHLQSSKNVKEVKAFTGLINSFGRFIPNYAAKTRCINELLQKDNLFNCHRAFQSLIGELTRKPLSPWFSSTDWIEKYPGQRMLPGRRSAELWHNMGTP